MANRNLIDAGGAGYELKLEDNLTRELQTALGAATAAVRQIRAVIDREMAAISQSIKSVGKQVAAVGAGIAGLGAGMALGLGKATLAAGDFAETVNMFEAVFKGQSTAVRNWARDFGREVGRAESDLLRFLAEAQDTFVPLGFDRKEAAELSKTVTRLAVDLGSFKNIDDGDAVRRLLSSLVGNTENLKAFGVVAQQAQIQAKALQLGFDPKNLTAQQKATAILQLTIEGTADAQGDAAKTAGGFNNSLKRLRGAVNDLQAALGGPLLGIAADFVQALAGITQKINDALTRFPVLSKVIAGLAVTMGVLGGATVLTGLSIVKLGTVIGAGTLLSVAFSAKLVKMTGILGGMTSVAGKAAESVGMLNGALNAGGGIGSTILGGIRAAIGRVTAAVAGLLGAFNIKTIVSGIASGFKLLFRVVFSNFGGLTRILLGIGKTLLKVVAGPISLIATFTSLLFKGAEQKYKRDEARADRFGKELEQRRREVLAETYRDLGLPVPDVTKTLDVNNARVAPPVASQVKPLTDAQLSLADEINGIQTAMERYRERIDAARELLKRGEISQQQFGRFQQQERELFERNDPAAQAREDAANKLKAAAQQFQNDVRVLKEGLRTPAEVLRDSIVEARRLLSNDPEALSRAIDSAESQFRATDPVEQLKQALMTPAERFSTTVEEYRKLLAGQPALFKKAVDQLKLQDPRLQRAQSIKDSLKSDTQRVAEEIGEAFKSIGFGLTEADAIAFARKATKDFLGDNPAIREIKNLATQSAFVASRAGAFAPGFTNTASEEKEFRRKAIELQEATNTELRKIRRKRLTLI